jgi:hypothetical protein
MASSLYIFNAEFLKFRWLISFLLGPFAALDQTNTVNTVQANGQKEVNKIQST